MAVNALDMAKTNDISSLTAILELKLVCTIVLTCLPACVLCLLLESAVVINGTQSAEDIGCPKLVTLSGSPSNMRNCWAWGCSTVQ